MRLTELIQDATSWLGWLAISLGFITLIFFLFSWGAKFRLVGATIFSFLLWGSCLAFSASYRPPNVITGAIYAPVVYDNGFDLVIAQAPIDISEEEIHPTLEQISSNLRGAGRNGSTVKIRLRKIEHISEGISRPVVLGEITKSTKQKISSVKTI